MPGRALHPNAAHFVPPGVPDQPGKKADVLLHYYGAGGWGIGWRGSYLLAAPYFSNHDALTAAGPKIVRNQPAIRDGFAGTPIGTTNVILIGHGHIDHAGDVPGFFERGLIEDGRRPALVADRSTFNLLHPFLDHFGCRAPLDYDASGRRLERCVPEGVEITPIHSAHAPHLKWMGIEVTAFDGAVKHPRTTPPIQGKHFRAGNVWAFVIDLKDERGEIVFRIHYMDAAASPPHGIIPDDLLAKRQVDVHIACVPGYDVVADYPETVLHRHQVRYVLAGHWEDFFRPRDAHLVPVLVLDEQKMETFVDRIERTLGKAPRGVAPVNKTPEACAAAGGCGPHGPNWTIPVPEETFWFVSGAPPAPPLPTPAQGGEE